MNRYSPTRTASLLVLLCLNLQIQSCSDTGVHNSYIEIPTVEPSQRYGVTVNGTRVFVGREECFGDRTFHTSAFAVAGETEITVTADVPITSYAIRPVHLNLEGKVEGNQLTFRVDRPEMLYVEVNDLTPLCLFQTPPETEVPDEQTKGVRYFGPGVHEVGVLQPVDGETIYLAAGAVLRGRVLGDGVKDVSILGRGILDARGYTDKPDQVCGVEFRNSQNIRVEGIGIRSGEWWQTLFLKCEQVDLSYLNLMSFGLNNDGIDIDGVSDLRVRNCFIGCGDDGFGWHAVSAEANGQPPTQDCIAEHCVIYNTHAGNGLRVGASMETEVFENITFRDITVLAHANAGIRSDHSDWATVRNLTFENFRMEQEGRPVEIRIEKTRYSNATGYRDERGHIENLRLINVSSPRGTFVLQGYDEDHLIDGVLLKDCTVAGDPIRDTTANLAINEFVKSLRFD